MNRGKRRVKRGQRRGTAVVQTVLFGSLVGFGCLALAIDTGLQFNSRAELQAAADAAALAAASRMGAGNGSMELARAEAVTFGGANNVARSSAYVDPESDVVFGRAVLDGDRYEFQPNVTPYNAVQVTVHRDGSDSSHPTVDMLFSRAFFNGGARISASATAMLVPRDIALVIDLSGSMNDDSEFRHHREFDSETQGTRPGVQINLKDVWTSLPIEKGNAGVGNGVDPPPPGNPNSENDQPGTGPGSPQNQGGNPDPGAEPQGGSSNPAGPRWGWMTGWGTEIELGEYDPAADFGLYYIPRYSTCTSADVISNLTESGYSEAERTALLGAAFDGNQTYFRNRVKVMLGLAGWRSKKPGGKYNGGPGNGDDRVDTNELFQGVSWPFNAGSWDDYLNYVASNSTQMYYTDPALRYRYGIKTVVNYLLEKRANNSQVPELAAAPEMPLYSAKGAVQALIDLIVSLDSQDYCSLEVFATTGRHEVDLSVPADGQSLAEALQAIPDTLNQRQAGHYDSTTNIGAGLDRGLAELQSERARGTAAKVMVLLTDGKPNVGGNGLAPDAYCVDRATAAAEAGITLYTVGLGADVDEPLLQQLAEIGSGEYFFADSAPDEVTGEPQYVSQLRDIFEELGGRRPVRLIR